jgi:hypothetical protein
MSLKPDHDPESAIGGLHRIAGRPAGERLHELLRDPDPDDLMDLWKSCSEPAKSFLRTIPRLAPLFELV